MKIRTKLLLGTIIEVVLVTIMIIFVISTSNRITTANQNEVKATSIVEVVTEIRFVTFEHLLHHDARSFEQWELKHDDLAKLLTSFPSPEAKERALLTAIRQSSGEVDEVFTRLRASYTNTAQDPALAAAAQERLATQLLVRQQSQISDALKLAALEREEAASLRRQLNWLVGVIVLSMLVIAGTNFMLITRGISRALAALQKGAANIARGQFDYRIRPPARDDEFGQIATAFNSMAASLEHIDKVKSEFILLASHQLRTPLTTLKWYADELIAPDEPLTPNTQKSYARQIHASNERMIVLVDQLLNASKVGFGSLVASQEPVDPVAALKEVLHDVSAERRKKKIVLTQDIGPNLPVVYMDPAWIRLVFQNLLSNAIRYSQAGKPVHVSLERKEGNLLITIKDQGCGIPRSQQHKIFTRLFRAENAQAMEGEGSGLGLYIAKAMVEQAKGAIWFESAEGKGTTFYVRLPGGAPS